MLVLTRRLGEAIRIGPDIVVRVRRIEPGRVSIGVDAPTDVEIWRDEIPVDEEDPLPDTAEAR